MKLWRKLPAGLIAAALLAMLWRSILMIRFVEPTPKTDVEELRVIWVAHHIVHEAGYAQMTIALIGLAILLVPFRRRELWAWGTLSVILFLYMVPIFVIPALVPFPGWGIFRLWIFEPGPRQVFMTIFVTGLMATGLGISLPKFLKRRAT